jgi:hypothetical protein
MGVEKVAEEDAVGVGVMLCLLETAVDPGFFMGTDEG